MKVVLRYLGARAAFSSQRARSLTGSNHAWRRFDRAGWFAGCKDHSQRDGVSRARHFCASPEKHSDARPLLVWNDEEQMVKDATRKFALESVAPLVKQMDRDAKMDAGLLGQMFANGYMGTEVSAEYGGSEMTFTQTCLIVEELARVDPAVSVIVDIHNTLNNRILSQWGSEQQKQAVLSRMATQSLSSFCLSEAGAGSDAFALRTTATESKDGGSVFVLNGAKMWISNAAEAEFFIVFASVDLQLGYKGITAFLVERAASGLEIGKKEDKLGIRASSCCEVRFDSVRVPVENIIGQTGHGYKIAIESLNEGRIGIGAQMVGLAQGALDAVIPYSMERKQFGKPIASFQGMQFQIAQALTEVEAARLLVYNAARLKDSGRPFQTEAAYAKLFASQIAQKVASQCIDWAGGVGFTREYSMEKFYRDAKIGQIYEGTSNMQLATIAKNMLPKWTTG
ncbi:putative short/branched chain specific acyl-CoA dehydrogenase [Porphyridium purpureum]|uniref:Short/branched chain specific acyl-CoA dehydrogenase, mitochondrial n=1 Tax=Porphyridium purpureum TaxID=35688 RepID=A0A5J4YYY5_PORPP|nr:putative short/branched chain specific acyl-CoA dehydrogenase [Porphyridium purpureum]|eukprot:POR8840..scf209_3